MKYQQLHRQCLAAKDPHSNEEVHVPGSLASTFDQSLDSIEFQKDQASHGNMTTPF